jgi:hypothetical protein
LAATHDLFGEHSRVDVGRVTERRRDVRRYADANVHIPDVKKSTIVTFTRPPVTSGWADAVGAARPAARMPLANRLATSFFVLRTE